MDFPLQFAVEFYWLRWRRDHAVDVVTLPGREFVDMEDGVNATEGWREFESIIKVANTLGYFIWS
jgi:hypothetical protein